MQAGGMTDSLGEINGKCEWTFFFAQSVHHLLIEGGVGGYSFHASVSPHHTSHKHRAVRCARSQRTVDAASPHPTSFTETERTTGVLTAHTCFLSVCTCSVGPQGSAVCLPLRGLNHLSLDAIWDRWWLHNESEAASALTVPSKSSFSNSPPTGSCIAQSAGAHREKGPWENLRVKIIFTPTS